MAKKPTKAQLRKEQIHQQLLAIYKARKVDGVKEYIASLTKKRERKLALEIMETLLLKQEEEGSPTEEVVEVKPKEKYFDRETAEQEEIAHKKKISNRKRIKKKVKELARIGKRAVRQYVMTLSPDDQLFVTSWLAGKGIDLGIQVTTSSEEFSSDHFVDYMETMIHEAVKKMKSHAVYKEVLITGINFDREKTDDDNRVGKISLILPKNLLFFRHWRGLGWDLVDASDYHLDQTTSDPELKLRLPWELPPKGKGLILWIREDREGRLYVRLPQFWSKKRKRFENPWRLKPSDFNDAKPAVKHVEDLEAAINAFLQVFDMKFSRHNPRFRVDYGEFSCTQCRHADWLKVVKDETDLESALEKGSNYVYREVDVNYTAAFGNILPKLWCRAKQKLLDYQIAKQVNEFLSLDRKDMFGVDKDGNYRLVRHDEIVLGGKIVKMADFRHEATVTECQNCPFFHRKTGKFETAKVSKQILETLTPDGWKIGVPGEFRKSLQFRVRGLSGIVVRGTNAIFEAINKGYIPAEEFDPYFESRKKIRDVWMAAFNVRKLSEGVLAELMGMIQEGLKLTTESLSQKWEKAKVGLARAILWAREDQPIPAFTKHFFAEEVEGLENYEVIRVVDVLSDFLHQVDALGNAGFHALEEFMEYEDLSDDLQEQVYNVDWECDVVNFEDYHIATPKELSYRLDPVVEDLVVKAVEEGVKFVVVDDYGNLDSKGLELLVDALQYKLQKRIEDFVWDCRRSQHPHEVLSSLLLTEEAKSFILEHSQKKAQG